MAKLEVDRTAGKMELVEKCSTLMPKGVPNFLDVVKYPKIEVLISDLGKSKMLKVIFLMVKDFCSSMNVVRNMNEDQMIEAAAMLIDECGNFRLEDYVMMFQLGKRGELVKIMDRIDLQVITAMLDEYWLKRAKAAENNAVTEIKHIDSLGSIKRENEPKMTFNDAKGTYEEVPSISKSLYKLAGSFDGMKNLLSETIGSREALAATEKKDTELIKSKKSQ